MWAPRYLRELSSVPGHRCRVNVCIEGPHLEKGMSLLLPLTCTTVTAPALPQACPWQNLLSLGRRDSAHFFWNCHQKLWLKTKHLLFFHRSNRIHVANWIAMGIWTFIFFPQELILQASWKAGLKLGGKQNVPICSLSTNWLQLRALPSLLSQYACEIYSWGSVIPPQVFWDSIRSTSRWH